MTRFSKKFSNLGAGNENFMFQVFICSGTDIAFTSIGQAFCVLEHAQAKVYIYCSTAARFQWLVVVTVFKIACIWPKTVNKAMIKQLTDIQVNPPQNASLKSVDIHKLLSTERNPFQAKDQTVRFY